MGPKVILMAQVSTIYLHGHFGIPNSNNLRSYRAVGTKPQVELFSSSLCASRRPSKQKELEDVDGRAQDIPTVIPRLF